MGVIRDFKCPACGYYAEVSGGADTGMLVSTTTIACLECKALSDVVTAYHDRPLPDLDSLDEPEVEPHCEENAQHRVQVWSHPGPCPKCSTMMEQGEMMGLWD